MTSYYIYGLFINGECCYIGSTVNVNKRFADHKRALYRGTHINKQLQKVFDDLAGTGEIECKLFFKVDDNIINRYVVEYLYTSAYQPLCNPTFNMSNGRFNWKMKLADQNVASEMLECI